MIKSPNSLIEELGIVKPEQIDVEAIATYCGAHVEYKALHSCAARIVGYKDEAIISVDSKSSIQRRRFSVAHELGHWMRDRGTPFLNCKASHFNLWTGRNPEVLANEFAADLLMPKEMFQIATRNLKPTFESLGIICDAFQTSLSATAIRMVEYGPLPSMTVLSSKKTGERIRFQRSSDLPSNLFPLNTLHEDSQAMEIVCGRSFHGKPIEIGADAWCNHYEAKYFQVVEQSISPADGTILSLIWFRDEKLLERISADSN